MRKALPAVLAFTDPLRTPDPMAFAQALPRGTGLVYRHFGAPDAEATARKLVAIARARGLKLLIGADVRLAWAVGADGVHLPQRLGSTARALRRTYPRWIVTCAAHSGAAARTADADAVVMSPIFPSQSPSAGRPLGPLKLAALVRMAGKPVYALGGVNGRTASRLGMTGVVGVAAVEGLTLR